MGLDWLNPIGTVLGGVGSIYGLLQGEREKRAAQNAQQAAIRQYQQGLDADYQANLVSGGQQLLSQAGYGADAIRNLGAGMGSNLAAAGVYNPSAVGGALANAQQNTASSLADLSSQIYNQQQRQHALGMQNLAGMQLGLAGDQLGQANYQIGTGAQGLQSMLGSMTQANLAKSGANAYRVGQPQMNGTQGQAFNLPGMPGFNLNHPVAGAAANAQYGNPMGMGMTGKNALGMVSLYGSTLPGQVSPWTLANRPNVAKGAG